MKKLILILALITIIFGTIYTVGQQIVRQGANEPQTQLAEDVAARIKNGADPQSVTNGHVDIRSSLAPFIMVYDGNGNPLNGSGYLDDDLPHVPAGAVQHATPGHDNKVTWQPNAGVRIAAVTVFAKDGLYVLSGRNLRETEKLENHILGLSALGWGLAVASTLLLYSPSVIVLRKRSR